MYWCSSAESEKLVNSIEDALEKVRAEGPNPMNLSQTGRRQDVNKGIKTPVE
jgi:hypothetical protein